MSDLSEKSGSLPGAEVRNPLLASVLDRLACPVCYGHLHLDEHQLRCEGCGRIYPIIDGIPVLIAEQTDRIQAQNGEPMPGRSSV
jgi:uncharacterized protein YbaR (Trm112 family)